MSLAEARALDAADPLSGWRDHFVLPEGVAYLDGNSLGALPARSIARIEQTVRDEWGQGLVRSWNDAGWIGLPRRVGDAIAPLIGASPGEVIVCDSTSVNLFKLVAAALLMRPGRKVVLSEPGNFPTDLYMLAGLESQGLAERRLAEAGDIEAALDGDVALLLLTHVHYKTGAMHDMARLTRAAHDMGALVLWDLSHSAGAVTVDLNGSDADFAVGCGYKYLNGGPGAPSFAFVAKRQIGELRQPLTGWMGHAAPFAFVDDYQPAGGIEKLLTGTPPILSLAALEEGVALIAEIGIEPLAAKSRRLSAFLAGQMAEHVPELVSASPADPRHRGSQLSWQHPAAYALSQALIARGVIPDFRDPDILRFGLAPAYVRFEDCWRAVKDLRAVFDAREHERPEYRQRAAVT
ncbi:MAG: kynureninase [Croceibacterium sp.]